MGVVLRHQRVLEGWVCAPQRGLLTLGRAR